MLQQPPNEAYELEVNGHLGRPELTPQVLVMYRDDDNGLLQVRSASDGDTLSTIDTGFRLATAVLDWVDRDDNTGTTTFAPACTSRSLYCGSRVKRFDRGERLLRRAHGVPPTRPSG